MRNTHPFPCPEWADALAALHADDLSAAEQVELEAHLAVCPACAQVRAGYLAMASKIECLPSVRPLAGLPERVTRERGTCEGIPTKPGPVLAERSLPVVPLRPRLAAQARHAEGAAGPVLLVVPPEEDEKEPDESRLRLADGGEPTLAKAYQGLSQLAEREVTGLAGLPERLPKALAVLPPVFSFARPARSTPQWQALVACFVVMPLLLVVMPLGALQRLGDVTSGGSTLDAYIQPLSFVQKCTGLLGLPSVAVTLDNSHNAQPLDWHVSIQDTDPSGSLPWAKADVTSGTVPAGARSMFLLTPLGVLCEIMNGAPAPIEYHVIFSSQGQRATITDRVTPP
jgi:hypothetical protein